MEGNENFKLKSIKLITERREECMTRLNELRSNIKQIRALEKLHDLCIYVTGSFGRREASIYSDLDLFFLHKGTRENRQVSNLEKTLLCRFATKTVDFTLVKAA